MFRQLLTFLNAPEAERKPPELRVAVAVLLLEAAHRDDEFGAEERTAIERLLTKKFALSAEECAQLLASCEATSERMTQLHPYTQAIFTQMPIEERVQFMEMLWEVVYADGVLDPEEDALIRRLGGLIYVSDRDRVLARQRALARLGRTAAD
ncbi:MAG: TerB family tellurite resistance protein [Alphaproteobacteria bacterium]|nr:TerB family tellurite resistance protein [Alphaproteobacteria bacterium]MDE1986993.1 TerB family tellurite resistance protein [Alphaproteobacteria bacterium]MDE2164214.1 TerB family tellurite resistance protein [Alphaproteobacteria bacterium]